MFECADAGEGRLASYQGKCNGSFVRFDVKMIALPRQARDKHIGKS
eukprot:COSAG06_NODE_2642_length_6517_cov_33.378778_1_plen_46_part_00